MSGDRQALLIATATYEDPRLAALRAPVHDAEALAGVLGDRTCGEFATTVLADRGGRDMRVAVTDFLGDRRHADLVLLYISGHGLRDARGRLYLAAIDTYEDRLAATGVPAGWLIEQLDECPAKRQVLILDCCFSGAFLAGAKGVDVWPELRSAGRGRYVLTASRSGEPAFEQPAADGIGGAASVFTAGIVEGLRSGAADVTGRGYITLMDAYEYAFDFVARAGGKQTPQLFVDRAEDTVVLARTSAGGADSVTAAAVHTNARPHESPWRSIGLPSRVGTVSTEPVPLFNRLRPIAIDPAGERVAVADRSGIVERRLVTGDERRMRLAGDVRAIGYSGSGLTAVIWDGRDLGVHRAGEYHAISALRSARVMDVALDRSGEWMAVAPGIGLGLVDLTNLSVRWLVAVAGQSVRLVALDVAAEVVAAEVAGGETMVIDPKTDRVVARARRCGRRPPRSP